MIPPVTGACPERLREALSAWRDGDITNADLVEVSYSTMLDILDEYRVKPLPTIPDGVRDYRLMGAKEKRQLSDRARETYQRRYTRFFDDEQSIVNVNQSNGAYHLRDLLEWAGERKLGESTLSKIRFLIQQHEDAESRPTTEPEPEGEPLLVHDGPEDAAGDPDGSPPF